MIVGILLFNEVEVLDFCGPFEVFSVTRLDESQRNLESSPFVVCLIAENGGSITTRGGMRVAVDHDFESCPPLDVLLVPGGYGTRAEVNNLRLVDWIQTQSAAAKLVTSVCTGAFLLAAAGLLNGRRATTHWQSLDRLAQSFPLVSVERRYHVVEDGVIMTSAGISAGIDLSLLIVQRFLGETIARATARYMEYPFPEGNARRI